MKRGNELDYKRGQAGAEGRIWRRGKTNNLVTTNLNVSTILKAYRFSYLVKIQKLLY